MKPLLDIFILIICCRAFVHTLAKNEPKYRFSTVSNTRFDELFSENAMFLSRGYIREFEDGSRCYIPNQNSSGMFMDGDDGEKSQMEALKQGRQIILEKTNSERVAYNPRGFWKYIFVGEGSVRSLLQVHEEVEGFILGSNKDVGRDSSLGIQLLHDGRGYYFQERLIMGEYFKPMRRNREVEVRYSCTENAPKISLNSVTEYQTCKYRAEIYIGKLCSLPIFSHDVLHVYCTEKDESSGFSLVKLMDEYKPTFLGSNFYFLSKYEPSFDGQQKSLLLYHDDFGLNSQTHSPVDNEEIFHDKIKTACVVMLEMGLLVGPDGQSLDISSQFEWFTKVINFEGNTITNIKINVEANKHIRITREPPGVVSDLKKDENPYYAADYPNDDLSKLLEEDFTGYLNKIGLKWPLNSYDDDLQQPLELEFDSVDKTITNEIQELEDTSFY